VIGGRTLKDVVDGVLRQLLMYESSYHCSAATIDADRKENSSLVVSNWQLLYVVSNIAYTS